VFIQYIGKAHAPNICTISIFNNELQKPIAIIKVVGYQSFYLAILALSLLVDVKFS
jgi:hypothetical protein